MFAILFIKEEGGLMNNFGKELRKIRKEFGVTMVQLQKHSGISQPYISQLETGKRSPTKEAIKSLVHGLAFSDTGYIGSIKEEELLKRLHEAHEKDQLEAASESVHKIAEKLKLDRDGLKVLTNYTLEVLDSVDDKFVKLEEVYSDSPEVYFTVSGEPLSESEKAALKIFIKGIKSNRSSR